jgi:hypothetical protein
MTRRWYACSARAQAGAQLHCLAARCDAAELPRRRRRRRRRHRPWRQSSTGRRCGRRGRRPAHPLDHAALLLRRRRCSQTARRSVPGPQTTAARSSQTVRSRRPAAPSGQPAMPTPTPFCPLGGAGHTHESQSCRRLHHLLLHLTAATGHGGSHSGGHQRGRHGRWIPAAQLAGRCCRTQQPRKRWNTRQQLPLRAG